MGGEIIVEFTGSSLTAEGQRISCGTCRFGRETRRLKAKKKGTQSKNKEGGGREKGEENARRWIGAKRFEMPKSKTGGCAGRNGE